MAGMYREAFRPLPANNYLLYVRMPPFSPFVTVKTDPRLPFRSDDYGLRHNHPSLSILQQFYRFIPVHVILYSAKYGVRTAV